MNLVKRATVGQIVKADITGLNNWVVGRISSWTDKKITFDTSKENGIECDRSVVYKATAEELTEFDATTKPNGKPVGQQPATTKPNGKPVGQQPATTTEEETTTDATAHVIIDTRNRPYEITACASGRLSKDNGDYVATALRGLTLEQVYHFVADAMDVTVESLLNRYKHLNPGHQRMCLGNKLRGFKADAE